MLDTTKIKIRNHVDENGKPAGGNAEAEAHAGDGSAAYGYPAVTVTFQDGPLGRGADRKPRNGAFVEDLIYIALKRIEFYNRCGFQCPENDKAIDHLAAALNILDERTKRRENQGVEGTHEGA